jgi:acetyltransferase
MTPGTMSDAEIVIRGDRHLRLHPVGPEDESALVELGRHSTPDDLRLRFFGPVRPAPGPLIARLANVDQTRDFVVAAYDPLRAPGDFLGVVRLMRAEDDSRGEFAILVRSDIQGRGLGYRLMQEMLAWAREHGVHRVEGDVLRENWKMLQMVKACGGQTVPKTGDYGTIRVAFDITHRAS